MIKGSPIPSFCSTFSLPSFRCTRPSLAFPPSLAGIQGTQFFYEKNSFDICFQCEKLSQEYCAFFPINTERRKNHSWTLLFLLQACKERESCYSNISAGKGGDTFFFAKEEGEKQRQGEANMQGGDGNRGKYLSQANREENMIRGRGREDNDRDSPTIQYGSVCFNYIFALLWRIPDICDKNTARRGGPRERGKSQGKQE